MQRHKRLYVGIAGLFLAAHSANATLLLNTNLVVNPGAEAGPGLDILDDPAPGPVPGWTTDGAFSVYKYTTISNSIPKTTDPGPPGRGNNFFGGGNNQYNPYDDNHSRADQVVDVSDAYALIDQGIVLFSLSGWLGGYYDQRDAAQFTAIFEDSHMNTIGTAAVGPVLVSDRVDGDGHYYTGLLYRSTNGAIPTGTRKIDFRIDILWHDGGHNDGYADDLSFVAATNPNAVPEPGTIGLMASGLIGVGWVARRRTILSSRGNRSR